MTLPSCFGLINQSIFDNFTAQMNAADSGSELQEMLNTLYNDLSVLESTIQSQLQYLANIESLLVPPSVDLSAIVTWVTSFINDFLQPIIGPAAKMAAQLLAIEAQLVQINAVAEQIAATKFPGFNLFIPVITIGCKI